MMPLKKFRMLLYAKSYVDLGILCLPQTFLTDNSFFLICFCVMPDAHRNNSKVMFAMQCLPFAFFASLVETDIKISLFFVDTHQGLECRRSPITYWKTEGSQDEIVKMLALIIQAQHA